MITAAGVVMVVLLIIVVVVMVIVVLVVTLVIILVVVIQFLFICVPTQQPKCQLQREAAPIANMWGSLPTTLAE
jgi:hypothetical protein